MIDLQSLLLWIGLGFLGGLRAGRDSRWLAGVVPLGLAVGAAIGAASWERDYPPVLDALALCFVGALVALNAALPLGVLLLLGGAVGALRGFAGAGLTEAGAMVEAGACVALILVAVQWLLRRPAGWRRIVIRACGSWLCAIGIMLAGVALAPKRAGVRGDAIPPAFSSVACLTGIPATAAPDAQE